MQKEKSYIMELLSDNSRGMQRSVTVLVMCVCVYLITEQYVYSCRPLPVYLIDEG